MNDPPQQKSTAGATGRGPQFGLAKAFLIVAGFAAFFAMTRDLGWLGVAISVVSGIALAVIIIVAKKKDIGVIVSTFAWSMGGAIAASMWCVSAIGRGPHEAQEVEAAYRIIAGAVFGWLLGCCVRRADSFRAAKNNGNDDEEPPPPRGKQG